MAVQAWQTTRAIAGSKSGDRTGQIRTTRPDLKSVILKLGIVKIVFFSSSSKSLWCVYRVYDMLRGNDVSVFVVPLLLLRLRSRYLFLFGIRVGIGIPMVISVKIITIRSEIFNDDVFCACWEHVWISFFEIAKKRIIYLHGSWDVSVFGERWLLFLHGIF